MKTKIFTPLLLLVAGMFTMLSCSKQESMINSTYGKELQTGARSARGSVKDSLVGTWYLRGTEEITTYTDKHRKADTVTALYGRADYIVKYYQNWTGIEMIKQAPGEYLLIPFGYDETAQHHIIMKEEAKGTRTYDFEVHFPKRSTNYVRLIQITSDKYATQKIVWHMERAEAMTIYKGRPTS